MKNLANLLEDYKQLENGIVELLKDTVQKSKTKSKFINGNCLDVSGFNYSELVIIDNKLTFLNGQGNHFSLFTNGIVMDDLIEIIMLYEE